MTGDVSAELISTVETAITFWTTRLKDARGPDHKDDLGRRIAAKILVHLPQGDVAAAKQHGKAVVLGPTINCLRTGPEAKSISLGLKVNASARESSAQNRAVRRSHWVAGRLRKRAIACRK